MGKFRKVNFKLWIFILLAIFFGLSLARSISKARNAGKRIEDSKTRVEKLKQEQKALEDELIKVQSDEFRERQLRDKLGLAKEGEVVIVLPDEEVLKSLVPKIPEEEDNLPDPAWKRWLHLFNF